MILLIHMPVDVISYQSYFKKKCMLNIKNKSQFLYIFYTVILWKYVREDARVKLILF